MPQGLLLRYGAAVAAATGSTLIAFPLSRFLDAGVLLLYVPAVMAAAWFGGLGPGLLTTILSVLFSNYVYLHSTYSLAVESVADIASLVVFSFVAFLISLLHTAQKRHQSDMPVLHDQLRERNAWLSLVFDLTRGANEAETVQQSFEFAIRRICGENSWIYAHVYLPEREHPDRQRFRELRATSLSRPLRRGEGVAGRTLESRAVEWVEDLRRDSSICADDPFLKAGARTVAAFPVSIGHEMIGVFESFSLEVIPRSETLVHLMGVVGLELGRVVECQRRQEGYSEAVWEQQRVIAQELHDGLGQELTGLGFISQSLTTLLKNPEETSRAARLTEGLQRALEQIRGLARGVSPVAPESDGLMTALTQLPESMTSAYGIPCRFECPRNIDIDSSTVATPLYRIAQEAVTNAAKHGKPKAIRIALRRTDEGIALSVTDDGSGIPAADGHETGSGLRIMRYRANAIGAPVKVEPAGGGGTCVTCVFANIGIRTSPMETSP